MSNAGSLIRGGSFGVGLLLAMEPFRRRRARSMGDASSAGGSSHRQEVRVDEYDVHPAYATISSPERDPDPGARVVDPLTSVCETSRDERAVEALAERSSVAGPGEGAEIAPEREFAVRELDGVETQLGSATTPGDGHLTANVAEVPDLSPGFLADVPLGRVEEQVQANGGQSTAGDSYVARSLDAMNNVLASLLGRMASLEQRSSNRSGTPTSDGLESRLNQMSLSAEPVRNVLERPGLDRPLASLDKVMAGTFSSDDSSTARKRAAEATRAIPGGLMPVAGPPQQHWMAVSVGAGNVPQASSASLPPGARDLLEGLPPVPPSSLGYFIPPECQGVGGGPVPSSGSLCPSMPMGSSQPSMICQPIGGGALTTPGSCLPMRELTSMGSMPWSSNVMASSVPPMRLSPSWPFLKYPVDGSGWYRAGLWTSCSAGFVSSIAGSVY